MVASWCEGSRYNPAARGGGLATGQSGREPPPIQARDEVGPRDGERESRRRYAKGNAGVGEAAGRLEGAEIMKTIQYLVRINRDPGSDWGASVPDLPGCVATAKTIDTVLRRIERAIELHVRGLREDGLPVPRPSHRRVMPTRRGREVDFYATVEVAA